MITRDELFWYLNNLSQLAQQQINVQWPVRRTDMMTLDLKDKYIKKN